MDLVGPRLGGRMNGFPVLAARDCVRFPRGDSLARRYRQLHLPNAA